MSPPSADPTAGCRASWLPRGARRFDGAVSGSTELTAIRTSGGPSGTHCHRRCRPGRHADRRIAAPGRLSGQLRSAARSRTRPTSGRRCRRSGSSSPVAMPARSRCAGRPSLERRRIVLRTRHARTRHRSQSPPGAAGRRRAPALRPAGAGNRLAAARAADSGCLTVRRAGLARHRRLARDWRRHPSLCRAGAARSSSSAAASSGSKWRRPRASSARKSRCSRACRG